MRKKLTMPGIPARLLLIEDDPNIILILKAWLDDNSDAHLVIDHAPSLEIGIERAKGAAAILADLTIPPHWRREMTENLIPELSKEAPVVVLTGYSAGSPHDDAKWASEVISEKGADMVHFKSSLVTKEGIGALFASIMAAIGRRLYAAKSTKETT
jgi:DNA-binding NarL/FixJ family response regulator